MKKLLVLMMALLLLVGCGTASTDEEGATEDTADATTEETITEDNIAVGETANFENYSVTLNSIRVEGENLIANITVLPQIEQEFSTSFVLAQDSEGNLESSLTEEEATMPAGQPFIRELSFVNNDLNRIIWMDEEDQAAWSFEPISSVQLEPAPTDEGSEEVITDTTEQPQETTDEVVVETTTTEETVE